MHFPLMSQKRKEIPGGKKESDFVPFCAAGGANGRGKIDRRGEGALFFKRKERDLSLFPLFCA